jgi:predicted permease
MQSLWQDLRYSARGLRTSRGFTAWVVGSLAIGMAVAIAALALLTATLTLPFPGVTDQQRLARVSVSRNCGMPDCWSRMSSPADYDALRAGLDGLQSLAAYTDGAIAVALPQARSMRGLFTSANYFDVLGVRAAAGRTFNAADADTHAAVAVLSHNVWTRELAADSSVIGKSIRVASEVVEIVGVAPPLFAGIDRTPPGGRDPDVWLPMWLADRVLPLTAAEERRQERLVDFVGRLKDRAEVPQVHAQARVLAAGLSASRHEGSPATRADVRQVWRVNPRNWRIGAAVVMPIPILVLVIACVNAANLMLARGSQRQREMAIRLAIGAGRGRIIRQLLVESTLLALLSTGFALPMAWLGLRVSSSPLGLPVPFDGTVLAFAVLTAIVTTLAFGLAPAVRVSAEQPSLALGSAGARRDGAPRQTRMRRALVVGQVALSLGLLATAWQLVATVRGQAVSSGTPPDRLLMARFDLRPLFAAPAEADVFYQDLVARAARLPGVETAGLARHASVWTFGQGAAPGSILVWRSTDAPDEGRTVIGGYAGGDLFDAVGLRVVSGRAFTDADRQSRPQVAVVNQAFASDMKGPALGSVLRVAPANTAAVAAGRALEVRIVGIIEPAIEPRYEEGRPAAKIYLPSRVEPEPALALYVRTRDRATTVAQPVRALVAQIAPRVPILEIGSLEEFNERSYNQQMWLARAGAFLGVVGLLLATAGLYGVTSYVVALRSREIAVRMAIGATARTILSMVLGQSMRLAAIGLLVGGGAAILVSRVIQAGYYGIRGIDPLAFGGAAALFAAFMLLASAIPAVRASRVDPVQNLKDA